MMGAKNSNEKREVEEEHVMSKTMRANSSLFDAHHNCDFRTAFYDLYMFVRLSLSRTHL